MVYGYARISTPKQSIDRQIRNIRNQFPSAYIVKEAYTGTKIERPEFDKLLKRLREGDTVVFDSVSRMSRNAKDGAELYFLLYDKGIELVFLKEGYIDTATFRDSISQSIQATGNEIADLYIEATNRVIKILATKQIEKAFEQSQKEVDDLRQRTKEGIQTARLNGKQIGQAQGRKLHIKKADQIKPEILKKSKSFNGYMSDTDLIKVLGIARNTYYKYKAELSAEHN